MAKVTSSSDRSKRTASKRPTSSATRATRSAASSNSKAVTSSATRSKRVAKAAKAPFKVTGRAGRPEPTGKAKVTAGKGSLVPGGSFKAPSIPKPPAAVAAAAKGGGAAKALGRAGILGAVAAAGINAGSVADGTLKGKPVRPAGRAKPKASKAENATAADFGKSFKKARSMGSKEFMWKGKRYNTKRKDGR
jgi:hypothetical protein